MKTLPYFNVSIYYRTKLIPSFKTNERNLHGWWNFRFRGPTSVTRYLCKVTSDGAVVFWIIILCGVAISPTTVLSSFLTSSHSIMNENYGSLEISVIKIAFFALGLQNKWIFFETIFLNLNWRFFKNKVSANVQANV